VKLAIAQATPQTFEELARWRYPPPYDFYNGDVDPVLNPERFYEARDEAGELIGFLYFEEQGDGVVEIGLGLRPDLTGRGLGLDFVHAGLDFAREQFAPSRIVLNVAAFNKRTIAVYERAGFRRTGSHVRRFMRWGDVPFVEMEETP
jgi:[ribosomal protein S18]-alanine N-acetyltransferase